MPPRKFPHYYNSEIYRTLEGVTKANIRLSAQYNCRIVRFYRGEPDKEPHNSDRLRTKSYTWMLLLESEK